MATNHHTDIAAGAAATAATFNAPLGQLDAKLTHTNSEYSRTTDATTTVTTASTWYAVTSWEVSFTPAYSGQVFLVTYVVANFFADKACEWLGKISIVDGTNTNVVDEFMKGRHESTTTNYVHSISGARLWTAAAGDVGATRKAKLYVSATVNTTVVTTGDGHVSVSTH